MKKLLILLLIVSGVARTQTITTRQGDSFTMLLVLDSTYTISNLKDISVYINNTEAARKTLGTITATNNVRAFRVPLASSYMRRFQGNNSLQVAVYDSLLGVKRTAAITLTVTSSNNNFSNGATNTGIDATININVTSLGVTSNVTLATIMKGDPGTSVDTTLYLRKLTAIGLYQPRGSYLPQSDTSLYVRKIANYLLMSTTEKSKLAGIASGATANSTDAQLRDRSTHTGTQANTTITGLGTASTLNVAASGNAASGEVVKGNDTRLSDARTPTTHSHTTSDLTDWTTAWATRFAAQSTTGLTEGTNLYHTTARVQSVGDARYQPLNSNLTIFAGLTATTDNFLVGVSSAWASRTPAQVRTTLGLVPGTDVATQSSLANYLPIVGGDLTGTAGAGYHGYIAQSSAPTTPSTGFRLYANSSNALSWKGANGFVRVFDGTSNTADRTYTLPDASGTFGLLGSTQTWSGENMFARTTTISSGVANNHTIAGTINQSGTAGYRSLWVSTYEQSTGSGSKFLLDIGTNSAANGGGTHTSRFSVSNTGTAGLNIAASSNPLDINIGAISNGGIRLLHSGTVPFAILRIKNVGISNNTQFGATSNNDLEFLTNNNIVGSISSAGNWFLGSSPVDAGYRLDVNGIARVQGAFSVTGSINITAGANKAVNTATLSGGTVTVSNTTVTASSIIYVTGQNCSSCGSYYISAKSAGTSFTITSTNASDASTVAFLIVN